MPVATTVVDEVLTEEEKAELESSDGDGVVEPRSPEEDMPTEEQACGPVIDLEDGEDDADEGGLPLERISKLSGVKLLYGRGSGAPKPRKFPVDADFKAQLAKTVLVVVHRAPEQFGDLQSLTSAGMFVKKPNSLHAVGRACDWDVWKFADVTISPFKGDHASPKLAVRRRYWSLAALMRSNSAYVLHAEFNAAHKDHIHQDNGAMTAFDAGSGTTVKLVQALCNEVFQAETPLRVDGVFGGKTKTALREALETLQLGTDVTRLVTWRRFLRRSGRLGFRLSV
jgi:hypothetical protein